MVLLAIQPRMPPTMMMRIQVMVSPSCPLVICQRAEVKPGLR